MLSYFKLKRIIISLLFLLMMLPSLSYANENTTHQENTINIENVNHNNVKAEHKTDTSPLFFIIIAVIIGAATRYLFQKSVLPFTVILLLIGIALGVFGRFNSLAIYDIGGISFDFSFLDKSISWAGHIDPHLLLYVFLPILVFEAAFAMDVHIFKKTFVNATIMAVPGIIVAIFLTAFFVASLYYFHIGIEKWTWTMALLFGAVISATDPVAVVSILKESGASKKLGTLIDGESLLNDGTAIVIFMVIFLGLTGEGGEGSPFVAFIKVSFGGTAVGFIVGWLVIKWIKKVFNDALVEITVIIAAAYINFFIAEHFLHVSGVLALVTFGLVMASYGKTKISPEVHHFLHEFWELAAFIANTLIFLIVGVVIAERTVFTSSDLLVLILIYIGIFIVRAIVIALFYPVMKRIGYGLDKKDSFVLFYGALRGAIGLALALIVASTESIDVEIRNQFLFFTAGIVTLTLLINATTIKLLVNKLGLAKPSPAKILAINNANKYVLSSAEKNIEHLKLDRYLKRANWKEVRNFLPSFTETTLSENINKDTAVAASRIRILEKEKSSYWHQFEEGLLGDHAYKILTGDINNIIDSKGHMPLSERSDMEEMLKTPIFLSKAQNYPFIGKIAKHIFFEKLTTSYDCAKGFVTAQEDSLKLIASIYRSADAEEIKNLQEIEEEINENRIEGLTFLRNLGKEYPEIYAAISTREAIRTMLNYERHIVERLYKRGRIAADEAENLINDVESRMKQLRDASPVFELPNAQELLQEVSWLHDINSDLFSKIAKKFSTKIYNLGDILLHEEKFEDGMFIVVRGNIRITVKDKLIDLLGPGSTVGEVAALNGNKRTATVTAETPLTVLWMSSKELKELVTENKEIEEKIWKITAVRYAYYLLKDISPYNKLSSNKFKNKLKKGVVNNYSLNNTLNLKDKTAILISGSVTINDKELHVPAILSNEIYTVASSKSKVFSIKELS